MARSPQTAAMPEPKPVAPIVDASQRVMPAPEMRRDIPIPRDGRAVVIGRDGQPLYRGVGANEEEAADPYQIAAKLQPPGYVYEWKRYATVNEPDYAYQSMVQRVGAWRPVMNDRHPGVWLPVDYPGAIIVEGMILMERPIELHMEALDQERRKAQERVGRAKRERALTPPAGVGVDTQHQAARNASFIREGRLLDGQGTDGDGMTDADAVRAARPKYNYDREG